MRFRLGMATGFAAGYYLGTKAGRQRYDQINRALRKLRRSDALENATDRARTVLEDGVDQARSQFGTGTVETGTGEAENGQGDPAARDFGLIIPGQSEPHGGPPIG